MVFLEIFKFNNSVSDLINCVPMSVATAEVSFSKLKIKNYLRNDADAIMQFSYDIN